MAEYGPTSRSPPAALALMASRFVREAPLLSYVVLLHSTLLVYALLNASIPLLHPLIAGVYLTTVPGLLVLALLSVGRMSAGRYFTYAIGLSWSVVLAVGTVSAALPIAGPFAQRTVQLSVLLTTTGLLFLYFVRFGYSDAGAMSHVKHAGRDGLSKLRRAPTLTLYATFVFVIVLVSTLVVYNAYEQEWGPLLAVATMVPILVLLLWRANRTPAKGLLAVVSLSVSLLYLRSLQGNYVNGFDIVKSISFVELTLSSNRLLLDVPANYTSVLTTNVIPIYYHQFLDIPVYFFHKYVLLLVFGSVLVVGLYAVYTPVLQSRGYALVAVMLVIADINYYPKLPGVPKVVFAELFFVLFLVAAIDGRKRQSPRFKALSAVFGAVAVVSHYSTAWILLGLLALSIPVVLLYRRLNVRHIPLVGVPQVLAVGILSLGWYSWVGRGHMFRVLVLSGTSSVLSVVSTLRTLVLGSDSGTTTSAAGRSAVGLFSGVGTAGIFVIKLIVLLTITLGTVVLAYRLATRLWSRPGPEVYVDYQPAATGYLALLVPLLAGLSLYTFGSSAVGLPRYLHLTVLIGSPFAVRGVQELASVLPALDIATVARAGFTVLLVAMLLFNSGTVTHLEGDRDVSMYGLEEVQIERTDVEGASFLVTYGAPLRVFGGQYVKLKLRGGYALGDKSVRRQQVINPRYRVMRFPFEDLGDGYVYLYDSNVRTASILLYDRTTGISRFRAAEARRFPLSSVPHLRQGSRIYDGGDNHVYRSQ